MEGSASDDVGGDEVNPFSLATFSREKFEYMALFDIEKWYNVLEHCTFRTAFLPLKLEDGIALVHWYQRANLNRRDVLTREEQDRVSSLRDVLQKLMESMGAEKERQKSMSRRRSRSEMERLKKDMEKENASQSQDKPSRNTRRRGSRPSKPSRGAQGARKSNRRTKPRRRDQREFSSFETSWAENEPSDFWSSSDKIGKRPGFFVRLSTRSPKDVGLDLGHPRILRYVREEMDRWLPAPPPHTPDEYKSLEPNIQLRSMFDASSRVLRTTSAREALWLILHSERTYSDLVHAIDHVRGGGLWNGQLVVREWCPDVWIGGEFRCFVCEDRMTAISQYTDMVYYPSLSGQERAISTSIHQYWKRVVRPHMKDVGVRSYVLDVVFVGRETVPEEDRLRVVELNPFGPVTGSSLFSWNTERRVLQGGVDVWGDLDRWEAKHECACTVTPLDDGSADDDHGDDGDDEGLPVVRVLHEPPEHLNREYLDAGAFPLLTGFFKYIYDGVEDEDEKSQGEGGSKGKRNARTRREGKDGGPEEEAMVRATSPTVAPQCASCTVC